MRPNFVSNCILGLRECMAESGFMARTDAKHQHPCIWTGQRELLCAQQTFQRTFRSKKLLCCHCSSEKRLIRFNLWGEIARSKSRIASDLKTRDSNRWRPCDSKLRFETRDWRLVLNTPIQQNCEKGCDLSPRSKIASDWRLAILPI